MKKTITQLAFFFATLFISISAYSQNYVDFYAYPDNNCAPAQLYITNYSSISNIGPIDYRWIIDGTIVSYEASPSVPFPLGEGDHPVTLEVWDLSDNSLLGTQTYNTFIYGKITDFNISTGAQICPGQTVTFSINNVNSSSWDFGYYDYFTTSVSQESSPSFTYEKAGNYTVTLIANNFCGTDTVKKVISVSNAANPTITAAGIQVLSSCVNDPVKFSTYEPYASYFWEFGDGKSSTSAKPIYTYGSSGTEAFTAKLTVTNQCGGASTVDFPVQLQEGIGANASFNYVILTGYSACPGTPIEFKAQGEGTYFWDFGDGNTSTERNKIHYFGREGEYLVTLTVTNGCYNSTSQTNYVNIVTDNYSNSLYPYFSFETPTDGNEVNNDTLYLCPGQNASFLNQTYGESGTIFTWNFGEGPLYRAFNASHVYTNPGIFEVVLTASNICGGSSSYSKYVKVDNGIIPNVQLMSNPTVICPGEEIYFWDDNYNPLRNYTYSIIFGDGNSVNNIKEITDPYLETIASHSYNSGGSYTYSFFASNACGKTVSANGVITVSSSTAREPFYFIENSTIDKSIIEPADWSVRNSPTDFEVEIPIIWPSWIASYGTDFYVFLYYGGYEQHYEGNVSYPDGIVRFTSTDIATGTTVKAYVPSTNLTDPNIGIAAGYFCGGVASNIINPEASGALQENYYMHVFSIPVIPSGSTNLAAQNMNITIEFWDGVCNSERIENQWYREIEPGVFVILSIYESGYEIYFRDGVTDYNKSKFYEGGQLTKISKDTITLQSYYNCGLFGNYRIVKPDDNWIQFIPIDEQCPDRASFITGTFQKIVYTEGAFFAACPGDMVQFKIAGGSSYRWDFDDGNTSTLQYPLHAYGSEGIYNASVIATNSCGRKDTLYSKVTIANKKSLPAYFHLSEGERATGDSITFIAESVHSSSFDSNTYLWNFGDGTTSTLKRPVHAFRKAGEYTISLTTTNGCGTSTYSQLVYINTKFRLCDAQFNFYQDESVSFSDASFGNPTAWAWDFGDGTYSTEPNPTHNYLRDGIYMVTLTIFNQETNCLASISKKVVSGDLTCDSEFDMQINTNSGLASFFARSESNTAYYWDFGDGQFSTEINPVHTYKKSGIFKASLSVYDQASGCKSESSKNLKLIPEGGAMMLADFSYFADPSGLTVSFSDLSSQNTSNWYWTMGDGKVVKAQQNPVHTYSKPGTYKVCLMVYDNISTLSNSICKEIRVGNVVCDVKSDFAYFITPAELSVAFTSQTKGAADNYFWNFGDGSTSTLENPIKKYSEPGYYKVSLAVRNSSDKCIDQLVKTITVGGSDCKARYSYRMEPENSTVHFKDNSWGEIDYYYWDFGDGSFGVLPNPDHQYKKGGMYEVSHTVIDFDKECMDMTVQQIQLGEVSCAADFVTYIDSANYTAYFTNRILGESTAVLWSFGDGKYSTDQNPVHKFPGAGIYSAGLNTYDFNTGCMDYYHEMLLIGEIGIDCNSDFIYRVNPLNKEVLFSNKSTGNIVESLWNFGDDSENSSETNPPHTYEKAGYYYVSLSVINSKGVKNMKGKWIMVQSNSVNECRADFMFTIDSLSRKVKFVDNSFGDINKYTWDFGDGSPDSASFLQNPTHTYAQKGYYLAKLKVENSLTGCTSSEYKLLNVAETQILKASFGYEAFEPDKKRAGYPVDLVSASSGDGATVEWDFGDKQIKKDAFTVMDSTSGIVTHYYALPGKYRVCLRITDPVSGQSDESCRFVYTKYGVKVDEIIETGFNLNVYPNPLIDFTNINYSLSQSQHIEISIFDQLGRKVETLVKARNDEGNHSVVWDTKTRTTGVYLLKFVTSDQIVTRQLVITK